MTALTNPAPRREAIIVTEALVATWGALLLAWALLLLVTAFALLCRHCGTLLLWNHIVHEDGVRTFAQTLLFYEHATRELPIDLLLGVGVGAAAWFTFPGTAGSAASRAPVPVLANALLGVVAVIIVGAALVGGWPSVGDNLLQNHTRPGAPLIWGAHWRYHLLERGPLVVMALGCGALLRALTGAATTRGRSGLTVALWVLALFVVLTLVFTRSFADLALPFRDPRYLGHQAREIFTHFSLTVPLTWGAVMVLHRGALPGPAALRWPDDRGRLVAPCAAIAGAAGCWLYVAAAAVGGDSLAQGQSTDLVTLLIPHVFEHGFSYLVTPLTAALTYALCRDRAEN